MENEGKKGIRLITLILSIIAIILALLILYEGFWGENPVFRGKTKAQINACNQVNDQDLFASDYDGMLFVANGNAYISINNYTKSAINQVIKVQGIDGKVKRVKAYQIKTATNKTFFAITESGKVYEISQEGIAKEYKYFKEYQVEDIIRATGAGNSEFVLYLKDKTKVQINVEIDEGTAETTVRTKVL